MFSRMRNRTFSQGESATYSLVIDKYKDLEFLRPVYLSKNNACILQTKSKISFESK